METLRIIALLVLLAFSAYTIYVTRAENFFKSLRVFLKLHWGRQVILDLYIGLLLYGFFIYLNEGSLVMTFAWLVPALILGNPVTLLYFVLNFDSIIAHFV